MRFPTIADLQRLRRARPGQLLTLPAKRDLARLQRDTDMACADIDAVRIASPKATLNELEARLGAGDPFVYLRFGDGDVNLLLGKDDGYQAWSPALGLEMAESFALSGPRYMKTLAIHSRLFGAEPLMAIGCHLVEEETATQMVCRTRAFFISDPIWSPVAFHYSLMVEPRRVGALMSQVLQGGAVFVSHAGLLRDLAPIFPGLSVVEAPGRNAYSAIDRTTKLCVDSLGGVPRPVLILAAGCSSRVVAKRISIAMPEVTIIDVGSVFDWLGGRQTRGWMAGGFLTPSSRRAFVSALQLRD